MLRLFLNNYEKLTGSQKRSELRLSILKNTEPYLRNWVHVRKVVQFLKTN